MDSPEKKSPLNRALKDAATDRTLADELLASSNLQELHTLCRRMIDERETLAKSFKALIEGWALVSEKAPAPDPASIAAVERIATEAMQFAREVVQAMKPQTLKPK